MQRLVLFAKRPLLGHVKTRLVPPLRPEQALGLYRAFLSDQLRFLRRFASSRETEVCFDEDWDPDPEIASSSPPVRISCQAPGDLGARLLDTFRRSAREGAKATVIIGVDSPTLPAPHVTEAFAALESGASGVVGPADDGGYVLIGMRRICEELFRDLPWGGDQVCRLTMDRAAAAGFALTRTATWYDVDDGESLLRLSDDLSTASARKRAPATARFVGGLSLPRQSHESS